MKKAHLSQRISLQNLIAQLALNPTMLAQFKNDRASFERQFKLATAESKVLSRLCLKSFTLFTEVIQGTREEILRQRFSSLAQSLSKAAWKKLLKKFHTQNIILSTHDDADLLAFKQFLEVELKSTTLLKAARTDWAMGELASGKRAALVDHGQLFYLYVLSKNAQVDIYELDQKSFRFLSQLSPRRLILEIKKQGIDL